MFNSYYFVMCFYLLQLPFYITFDILCMYGDIIIIKNHMNENIASDTFC